LQHVLYKGTHVIEKCFFTNVYTQIYVTAYFALFSSGRFT